MTAGFTALLDHDERLAWSEGRYAITDRRILAADPDGARRALLDPA